MLAQCLVSGRVYDGTAKEDFAFVNVSLATAEGRIAAAALTDETGAFQLSAPEGKYRLSISFLGYNDYAHEVVLSKTPLRLPRITLTENSQQLSEIQVSGQRSGMRLDIDKKVFDVGQNIVADGASASELLQNIPTVDVDTEGNVSMRGNSSVEIWINGRATGLSDTDKGQILEMLPAESIERVELISNPSAKYNPEGSAGIINIVLKSGSSGQYLGSLSVGKNYQEASPYPGGNIGASYTRMQGKWSFSLNASVRSRRNDNAAYTHRKTFEQQDTTLFNKDNSSANDRVNGFLKASLTYSPTDADIVGVQAYGMYGIQLTNKLMSYQSTLKGELLNQNYRQTHSNAQTGFYNVGADYTHHFVKERHWISALAQYRSRLRNSESLYHNHDFDGQNTRNDNQKQTASDNNGTATLQLDYLNKTRGKSTWEAGLKADLTTDNSVDRSYDSTAVGPTWTEDPAKYNPFLYKERIYAAYVSYSNKFDWFSFQAGVRGEYTSTEAGEVKRRYFEPFPTLYLSFELNQTNELQANYTRRINRPRGRRINSYVDRSDQTNITYGNPLLMPEYANVVELNYLKTWEKHTLTVSSFYRYTENVIQQVRTVKQDTMVTTYDNIASSQQAGLELIAKNRLFNNYLDLTSSASAYYHYLGGNSTYQIEPTENFSCKIKINGIVKIYKNISAQLSAYYQSPSLIAQGKTTSSYGLDLGAKASFFEKQLVLSFTVRDVLNTRNHAIDYTYSSNFVQEAGRSSVGRNYRLSLTWNFGNLSSKQKKQRRGEDEKNEDFDEDF